MEFNEKLQYLRKQHNLTQEQLAEKLYVSRAAVSKWESGKGYPNIESLKCISKVFSVSIDELLSSNELLEIAEIENRRELCSLGNTFRKSKYFYYGENNFLYSTPLYVNIWRLRTCSPIHGKRKKIIFL